MSYLYAIVGLLTLGIIGTANVIVHHQGLPPSWVYFWEMGFAAWLICYVPAIIEQTMAARWVESRVSATAVIRACWMIRSTVALTAVIYVLMRLIAPATGRVWDTIATILVATVYMLIYMLPNPKTYLTEGEPEL